MHSGEGMPRSAAAAAAPVVQLQNGGLHDAGDADEPMSGGLAAANDLPPLPGEVAAGSLDVLTLHAARVHRLAADVLHLLRTDDLMHKLWVIVRGNAVSHVVTFL